MSYSLTIEAPEKTANASYGERCGGVSIAWPQREGGTSSADMHRVTMTPTELGEMFLIVLSERYGRNLGVASRKSERYNGRSVFDALKACPVDADFDELIPKRTVGSGRAHLVDFAQLLREGV